MLADELENFWNMCLEIYALDSTKFLSAPGLAWEAALKKTKVKLDLITDINMLLIAEKEIRGGICHSIYRYAKPNNKYMKYIMKKQRIVIYSILGCKLFIWMGNVAKACSK